MDEPSKIEATLAARAAAQRAHNRAMPLRHPALIPVDPIASPAYASWDASLALGSPWLETTTLGKVMKLAAGRTLYRQGESHRYFYLLRAGFVHTTILRGNGSPLLLEIFGPGAIFGEGPAYSGLPRTVTALAVTDTVLSRYLPADIEPALREQPALATSLLRLLGCKNHFLVRKLTRFASADPQERVLELLARVARLDAPGATSAAAPPAVELTHEQIASMMALSRVTVTRALKSLAARGLLETALGRVHIRDRQAVLALLRST